MGIREINEERLKIERIRIEADKTKAIQLKSKLEKFFKVQNLDVESRIRETVFLKTIYYMVGYYNFEIPTTTLSKMLKQTHPACLNLFKKHEKYIEANSIYKFLYESFLVHMDLKEKYSKGRDETLDYNYEVERLKKYYTEKIMEVSRDKGRYDNLISKVRLLNDDEIKELIKYKIEPSIRMLKSKVTNEQLIQKQRETRTM